MNNAEPQHPDDVAIDLFAAKLKAKMKLAREKGHGGWDHPLDCNNVRLSDMLIEHVKKGDPVDVANFCMMLSHREASITPSTINPGAPQVSITGSVDEIDAPAWPFINKHAAEVGLPDGRIEILHFTGNGGVIVLWKGPHIYALAVTIRDTNNRTRCVRVLAPDVQQQATGQAAILNDLPVIEHKAVSLLRAMCDAYDQCDGMADEYVEAMNFLVDLGAPAAKQHLIDHDLLKRLVSFWQDDDYPDQEAFGSPGHGHQIPGVWDGDVKHPKGSQCEECATHEAIRSIVVAYEADQALSKA